MLRQAALQAFHGGAVCKRRALGRGTRRGRQRESQNARVDVGIGELLEPDRLGIPRLGETREVAGGAVFDVFRQPGKLGAGLAKRRSDVAAAARKDDPVMDRKLILASARMR